jgi:hypothetical protein
VYAKKEPQVQEPKERKPMTSKPRLIIVGGSAAGPSAAAKAKRVNPDLEVCIFEQGDFVSYGA